MINNIVTRESSNLNFTETLPLLPNVPPKLVLTTSVSIYVILEIYGVFTKITIYKPTKSVSPIFV